jgi:hypothetical protein
VTPGPVEQPPPLPLVLTTGLLGVVGAETGGAFATVTETGAEVVVAPSASVATTVIEWLPLPTCVVSHE